VVGVDDLIADVEIQVVTAHISGTQGWRKAFAGRSEVDANN
jgi:hypothetical protein